MISNSKISIEIGKDFIKILQGRILRNGKIDVVKKAEEYTQQSLIDDLLRVDTQLLSDTWARLIINNEIGKNDINITISGQSNILIREMDIPLLSPSKTYALLKFESKQMFPVNIDNYLIDYKQLSIFERQKSKMQKVLLIAIPRVLIESLIGSCSKLGLKLKRIDIESNALARLINSETSISKDNIKGICMVVNIMRYYITVVILKDRQLVLAKTFPNYELEKIYNSSREKTEEMLNYYPYMLNEVIENIAKFYEFYKMRDQDNMMLSNIFLTGEICNKISIDEMLGQRMNTKIDYLDNLKILNSLSVFANDSVLGFATTIGGLL